MYALLFQMHSFSQLYVSYAVWSINMAAVRMCPLAFGGMEINEWSTGARQVKSGAQMERECPCIIYDGLQVDNNKKEHGDGAKLECLTTHLTLTEFVPTWRVLQRRDINSIPVALDICTVLCAVC